VLVFSVLSLLGAGVMGADLGFRSTIDPKLSDDLMGLRFLPVVELGILFDFEAVDLNLPDEGLVKSSRLVPVALLVVASTKESKVNPVRSKIFTVVILM
jgi:hypothetical protein